MADKFFEVIENNNSLATQTSKINLPREYHSIIDESFCKLTIINEMKTECFRIHCEKILEKMYPKKQIIE